MTQSGISHGGYTRDRSRNLGSQRFSLSAHQKIGTGNTNMTEDHQNHLISWSNLKQAVNRPKTPAYPGGCENNKACYFDPIGNDKTDWGE